MRMKSGEVILNRRYTVIRKVSKRLGTVMTIMFLHVHGQRDLVETIATLIITNPTPSLIDGVYRLPRPYLDCRGVSDCSHVDDDIL